MFIRRSAVVLVAAALIACGGAREGAATAATAASGPDEWSKATWEERHGTMTWGVLPNMARRFQRFEGSAVPRLTCRTCHGADAEARMYKMPNASLMALDPARLPSPESSRIAKFMHEEVVPEMRELLESPTLSCNQCHPVAVSAVSAVSAGRAVSAAGGGR